LWQSFAWVNAELMKNVSEIGQLSILYQNEIKKVSLNPFKEIIKW